MWLNLDCNFYLHIQLVKVQKLVGSESAISIENLQSGLYNLKIYKDDNFIMPYKIIKK
jgi:hypothetical protein